MIAIIVIGLFGLSVLLTGVSILLKKPVGNTLPPRGPAFATIGLGIALLATAMWGQKNPGKMRRILKPGDTAACPLILSADDLYFLTKDKPTQFSGRKVEGSSTCQYDYEFRSGAKLKGKVDVEPAAHQDEWNKTCGNHPLSNSPSEVWMKKVGEDEQQLCFLTESFEGVIYLNKDADGLKWVRVLQARLPTLAGE
jgi:hypothetical protein